MEADLRRKVRSDLREEQEEEMNLLLKNKEKELDPPSTMQEASPEDALEKKKAEEGESKEPLHLPPRLIRIRWEPLNPKISMHMMKISSIRVGSLNIQGQSRFKFKFSTSSD